MEVLVRIFELADCVETAMAGCVLCRSVASLLRTMPCGVPCFGNPRLWQRCRYSGPDAFPGICQLQFWDTAGSDVAHKNMMRIYVKEALGAAMMYAVTNRASFNLVEQKILDFRMYLGKPHKLMLIGNKIDRPELDRKVSREEGEAMAEKYGMMFAEVSNKTGQGVNDAVDILAESIAMLR
jgi:small GTP-binding protein